MVAFILSTFLREVMELYSGKQYNLSEIKCTLLCMGIWYAYKNITKTGSIKPYTGDCPPYYDLKGTPWFDKLTKQIPELKKRTLELLYGKKPDLPQFLGGLVKEGRWESKAFLAWNMTRKLSATQGKEIFECVKDVPGIVSLFISILTPGTHVKAHNGDTDATYRLHIPILIPAGLPECGIKVAGISRPWAENGILTFCDANLHEVWNHSDKTRVILIIDVVRTEFQSKTRDICARVLSWIFLQKVMEQKIIEILPMIIKVPFAYMLLILVRPFFMLLQRREK